MTETKQQGIIAAKQNALQKKDKQPKTLKGWVDEMLPEIAKALPSVITPERFGRIVTTALSASPQLANCERNSFLGAMMQAAQLGLEPNTPEGKAYLIPYKNKSKGVLECQFQLGYQGMIELADRAGIRVDAKIVYEHDEFTIEYGLEPVLRHKPALKDRGEVIGYYAIWKGENGSFGFEYMSREDAEKHGKMFSQAFGNGPWKQHFDEMAKKTILKKVLKYAPTKTDFARAMIADEGTIQANPEDLEAGLDIVYAVDENGEEIPPEDTAAETTDPKLEV